MNDAKNIIKESCRKLTDSWLAVKDTFAMYQLYLSFLKRKFPEFDVLDENEIKNSKNINCVQFDALLLSRLKEYLIIQIVSLCTDYSDNSVSFVNFRGLLCKLYSCVNDLSARNTCIDIDQVLVKHEQLLQRMKFIRNKQLAHVDKQSYAKGCASKIEMFRDNITDREIESLINDLLGILYMLSRKYECPLPPSDNCIQEAFNDWWSVNN